MTDSDVTAADRDDTLTSSMDNVLAHCLARASYEAQKQTGGDMIDRGLALRKALEGEGFGVVKLTGDHYFIGQHPKHRTQATAQQAAEIAELRAEVERLRGERDNAIQQAQGWKMEATSHKSTVHEAYQHITGATGELGNWNGANPIIAALAREGEG